jgi:PilZ domain
MHLRRESSTLHPGQERRTMRRFDMRLPASVRVAGNGLNGLLTETQNVSARGVFFYLDRPLAEGARIEVTMTFPPHVTLTDPVRVRFTARVVRIENSESLSGVGVAAMIEEYEFLRSSPPSEVASDGRLGT